MLSDYALIYEVKLSTTANFELSKKIKPLVCDKVQECNWSLDENGFKYQCEKGLTVYRVYFDTLARRVTYEEFAD
ncbi:hypothetical protein GCM10027454_20410 [Algoriphagus aestuariicola]